MVRGSYISLICLLGVSICTPAYANSLASTLPLAEISTQDEVVRLEQVKALFRSGAYHQARMEGQALGTSDSLALAAEALSAQIMLGLVDKPHKQSMQAVDLAKQALDIDPDNPDAIMQYALTYGFLTRTSKPLTAWRKKYPNKSLQIIEMLRKTFPGDPRGDALLAAWHLGVIRKTGLKNGEKWFGADLDTGLELYEMASLRAPDDIIISSNFAVARFVLAPEQYHSETRALLTDILKMPTATAIERDLQVRMTDILNHFDDIKTAVKKSEAFLDSETA